MKPIKSTIMAAAILTALSATTVIIPVSSDAAGGAKTKFERNKPHVNVGTIGHHRGTKFRPGSKNLAAKKYVDLVPLAPNPVGPLPGAPNSGFCGSNLGGGAAKHVLTSVKNNGNTAGGTFHNKVIFPQADPADRVQEDSYTDAGQGFNPAKVFFVIPASAWKNGKASFMFIVDSKKAVGESSELNNIYSGHCVEPAV
jgi:outer membrane lipoprotein SlyB